jgi:hypothetical protein
VKNAGSGCYVLLYENSNVFIGKEFSEQSDFDVWGGGGQAQSVPRRLADAKERTDPWGWEVFSKADGT